MDERVKNLKPSQRIALARLLSDLVMADKIIDKREITEFHNLFGDEEEYETFLDAQKLTFEQAVYNLLNDGSSLEKESARNILSELSQSDGICDPNEAYIQMAFRFMLESKGMGCSVQSLRLTNTYVSRKFIIYAEPSESNEFQETYKAIRNNIENNYGIISHLLGSIGFQFIFIPRVVNMYEQMGEKSFKSMVKYIFPTIDEKESELVYKRIRELDVRNFSEKYLQEKMGMWCSSNHPELFITIGQSEVITQEIKKNRIDKYLNFIKLELSDADVKSKIERIVCMYNDTVSYNNYLTFNPSFQRIEYRGFFKLFFNLVARPLSLNSVWTLNFYTGRFTTSLSINKIPTKLDSGHAALYLAILFTSYYGDTKGFPINDERLTNKHKERYEKIYECCYQEIKGDPTKKPSSIFNNLVNRLNEINYKLYQRDEKKIDKNLAKIVNVVIIDKHNKHYKITYKPSIKIDDEILEETVLYQNLSRIIED